MARHPVSPITVNQLVAASGIDAVMHGDASTVVSGISQDSRSLQVGDLFCCIRGEQFDGHDYVNQAIANGAVALLVEKR